MNFFTIFLTNLQAVIAAKAARQRNLTVLLVVLYARIARMGTRLERLIRLWRAGKLPKPRAPRIAAGRTDAPRRAAAIRFPTAPGWLRRRLGHEVGAYGSQLQHLLTDVDCAAFLAAVPQAGRILRPLLRMLSSDPLPAIVRKAPPPPMVAACVPRVARRAISPNPELIFSRA